MKKKTAILSLMLCVAIPLTLAGCANSSSGENSKNENAQVQQEKQSDEENKQDQAKENTNLKQPDQNIEKAIMDDLKLSDEDAANTRYYYEKADLDSDGKDETLVLVAGPTVSGSGGTLMYILEPQDDGSMKINQDFTLVNPPVYISKDKTNDHFDILIQQSGGGATTQWKALKFKDGKYTTVEEAEPVEFKEENTSAKLFNDDLAKDVENGTGLYLKPSK